MAPVTVRVTTRSGRDIAPKITIDTEDTVDSLKKALHRVNQKYPAQRQRLTLPPAKDSSRGQVLEAGKKLSQYGITEGSIIHLKDLGPQIGYSTVFVLEYLGPLLVYPLFFLFPRIFYSWYRGPIVRHQVQQLALMYWEFHYFKRILETLFVHKFSHGTMPLFNLFKNSGYYWSFAAWVSWTINHPFYTPPPSMQSIVAIAVAMLCQLGNFQCHIILSRLRSSGGSGYSIPRGFLFDYITCANYTCEIVGWLCFAVAVQSVPAAVFAAVGAAQMAAWAAQKHARLRKVFDGKDGREKYPRRWIMLPPFF